MKSFSYVISCYGEGIALFSVPIHLGQSHLRKILGRGEYPVNGDPLTLSEFNQLRSHVSGGVEIGWFPNFSYFLESRSASVPEPGTWITN